VRKPYFRGASVSGRGILAACTDSAVPVSAGVARGRDHVVSIGGRPDEAALSRSTARCGWGRARAVGRPEPPPPTSIGLTSRARRIPAGARTGWGVARPVTGTGDDVSFADV